MRSCSRLEAATPASMQVSLVGTLVGTQGTMEVPLVDTQRQDHVLLPSLEQRDSPP